MLITENPQIYRILPIEFDGYVTQINFCKGDGKSV